MPFHVMPNYFLVRIDKKKQAYLKTHVSQNSIIYMPPGSVNQSRNMEHGQIVSIGDNMKNIYEDCKIGYILIFHWSVESPQDKTGKRYFIHEDENFNYYVVDEVNVRGYFDGKKIVPHPNFIFLKNVPAFADAGTFDELTQSHLKETENGIVVFTDWDKSPQRSINRINKIKTEIAGLLKSTRTDEIQLKLEALNKEEQVINREIKKNKFLPYRLAYSNKKVDRDCGIKLQEDDILYCFNKAALYITNFQDKEYTYIILPTEHIGLVYKTTGEPLIDKEKSEYTKFITADNIRRYQVN